MQRTALAKATSSSTSCSSTSFESRGRSWLAALLSAIPLAAALTIVPEIAHAEVVHVVGKGQTLGRIAKRYRVTVDAIRDANNLKPGERIHPGLSLTIPEKGKEGGAKKDKSKPEKSADRTKKGSHKAKRDEIDDKRDTGISKGPKRRGYVRLVRGTETLGVQLLGRRGHLAPNALAGLSKMLRFFPTGEKTPIDPRLAALIGEVSDHFGGKPILITSGYRPYTPAQYTKHSNHNLGRALDFSVDGVPSTVVRDFCRTFRNAGVGYYPNSTFVHLDVRTGKAYWVDSSRPGEAPHYGSQSSPRGADESSGDVEPHPGGGPSEDGLPGSSETP